MLTCRFCRQRPNLTCLPYGVLGSIDRKLKSPNTKKNFKLISGRHLHLLIVELRLCSWKDHICRFSRYICGCFKKIFYNSNFSVLLNVSVTGIYFEKWNIYSIFIQINGTKIAKFLCQALSAPIQIQISRDRYHC